MLVEAIEARGGEVRLKTAVKRIVVENGSAAGVELADGQTVRARAVVSNADLKRTLSRTGRAGRAAARTFRARLAAAEPANSCFSVHLGVDFVPDIKPATHLHAPMHLGIAMMSKLRSVRRAARPFDPDADLAGAVRRGAEMVSAKSGGDDWKEWRRSDDYEQRKNEFGDRDDRRGRDRDPGPVAAHRLSHRRQPGDLCALRLGERRLDLRHLARRAG